MGLPAPFNPLNPELNPICYLLALLGAHHFLHVSRLRVKLLTFRLLMSYIYIYGAPILDVSRSHTTTQHSRQNSSGRVISSSQRPSSENTQHSYNRHPFEPKIPASERPQTYALGYGYIGARTDITQQSGQTPDKEVEIQNITVYVSGCTETDTTGMLPPTTAWPFIVAVDINSNVFDFYFLIWSLSRLLCCVGSGFSVAAALYRAAPGTGACFSYCFSK